MCENILSRFTTCTAVCLTYQSLSQGACESLQSLLCVYSHLYAPSTTCYYATEREVLKHKTISLPWFKILSWISTVHTTQRLTLLRRSMTQLFPQRYFMPSFGLSTKLYSQYLPQVSQKPQALFTCGLLLMLFSLFHFTFPIPVASYPFEGHAWMSCSQISETVLQNVFFLDPLFLLLVTFSAMAHLLSLLCVHVCVQVYVIFLSYNVGPTKGREILYLS